MFQSPDGEFWPRIADCLAIMLGFFSPARHCLKPESIPWAVSIGGGLVLMIIAIRMIFPLAAGDGTDEDDSEPLMVPLAVPMIAGLRSWRP